MKSYGVTIQMKPLQQYFHMVLVLGTFVKGLKCGLEYVFTIQGVAFYFGIPFILDSIK